MQRPRTPSKLSMSVQQRLNMYAVAASAAGVGKKIAHSPLSCAVAVSTAGLELLATAVPAQAKIVYTATSVSVRSVRLPLDLNHDGIADFSLQTLFQLDSGTSFFQSVKLIAYSPTPKNQIMGQSTSGGIAPASALRHGVRVGKQGPFLNNQYGFMAASRTRRNGSGSTHGTSGQWANKGKGVKNRYLGLKFYVHGKVHFGWARLNVKMPGVFATLTGYAYETVPNKSITAGKTKGPDVITLQPATLGHLAQGASAISSWRRTGGNQ